MTKKHSAINVVTLFMKVVLPLAPKTVDDAPEPNAAPASAPATGQALAAVRLAAAHLHDGRQLAGRLSVGRCWP